MPLRGRVYPVNTPSAYRCVLNTKVSEKNALESPVNCVRGKDPNILVGVRGRRVVHRFVPNKCKISKRDEVGCQGVLEQASLNLLSCGKVYLGKAVD